MKRAHQLGYITSDIELGYMVLNMKGSLFKLKGKKKRIFENFYESVEMALTPFREVGVLFWVFDG